MKTSSKGTRKTLLGRYCAFTSPLRSVMFKSSLMEQRRLHTQHLLEPQLSSAVSWHSETMHRHTHNFPLLFQWFLYLYYSNNFPVESFSLVCTELYCIFLFTDTTCHLLVWQFFLFYVRENRFCIEMSGFLCSLPVVKF